MDMPLITVKCRITGACSTILSTSALEVLRELRPSSFFTQRKRRKTLCCAQANAEAFSSLSVKPAHARKSCIALHLIELNECSLFCELSINSV
jgi:hypothetical protein